jgi:hypothetical protein
MFDCYLLYILCIVTFDHVCRPLLRLNYENHIDDRMYHKQENVSYTVECIICNTNV